MQDLRDELDAEIIQTHERLAFWRQQQELQAGTELQRYIVKIVAGYEVQLDQLRAVRRILDTDRT